MKIVVDFEEIESELEVYGASISNDETLKAKCECPFHTRAPLRNVLLSSYMFLLTIE